MRGRGLSILVASVLGTLLLAKVLAVYADWLWFGSLGYESVLGKILLTRALLFLIWSVVFFAILRIPWIRAWHLCRTLPAPLRLQMLEPDEKAALDRALERGIKLASIAIALIAGILASGRWLLVLQFFAATPFGEVSGAVHNANGLETLVSVSPDPIFGNDLAFYIFKIPLLQFIASSAFMMLLLSLAGVFIIFIYDDMIRFTEKGTEAVPDAARLVVRLGGLLILSASITFYIGRYQLLSSGSGKVFGVGYTEQWAHIPALWILTILSVGAGITIFILAQRGNLKHLARCAFVLVGAVVLGRVLIPAGIQALIVTPTEIEKERQFLGNNIAATRHAYGLDRFESQAHAGKEVPTNQEIKENQTTLDNVRLWDQRPLLDTFKEQQSFRAYYSFAHVDVDRYRINGEYRQVAIAAREMVPHPDPNARSWVNNHLKYTHGYGIVMIPVNEFDREGNPNYYVSDILPQPENVFKVTQPRIYFGEFPALINQNSGGSLQRSQGSSPPDESPSEGEAGSPPQKASSRSVSAPPYVVVQTTEPEFDYPSGRENQYTEYSGASGVNVGNLLNRVAFAARFMDKDILLTKNIVTKSRILMHRNVRDRVQSLTPRFLTVDPDPYIVVTDNGRLIWIVDCYTTSKSFPYSEPVNTMAAHPMERRMLAGLGNYIRNSVKVTVDAYDGTTTFYVADETDPLIKTYQKLFPALFIKGNGKTRLLADMPADLKAHIRYPKLKFWAEAKAYNKYHMTQVEQFYQLEDEWKVANEVFGGSQDIRAVEPYYVIMRPRGEAQQRFLLMLPFTPIGAKKNLMTAWISAHCDVPDYPKVSVYTFPSGDLPDGPMLIESRIDQSPNISEQLSLWRQHGGGSDVIRGNLLVLPIGKSIVYVEPLYLVAEATRLPQIKKVIVASQEKVVMADSLRDGIRQVFGTTLSDSRSTPILVRLNAPSPETDTQQGQTAQDPDERSVFIRKIITAHNEMQQARELGNFGEYDRAGRELGNLIRQLEAINATLEQQ